ncbi:MAG TPA: hemolysin III family protein [Parvibaculum sp.]
MQTDRHSFPVYSSAEKLIDSIVHVAGIVLGLFAVGWLMFIASGSTAAPVRASLGIYGFGLLAMLGASAAYNMTRPGRIKAWLRRLDHAMIYVMIAGTYTPFALYAVRGKAGVALCAVVWAAALVGIVLKTGFPRRLEWLGFGLYLGMGWMVVAVIGRVYANLQGANFALLVAGGAIYTLGSAIHHMSRLKFHNAIWHALVLVAAATHFVAIADQFAAA